MTRTTLQFKAEDYSGRTLEVETWEQDGKDWFQVESLEGYRFHIIGTVNRFEEQVFEVFCENDKFCNVLEIDPGVFEAWTSGNIYDARTGSTPIIAAAQVALLNF